MKPGVFFWNMRLIKLNYMGNYIMGGGLLSLQRFIYYNNIINMTPIQQQFISSYENLDNHTLDHISMICHMLICYIDELEQRRF